MRESLAYDRSARRWPRVPVCVSIFLCFLALLPAGAAGQTGSIAGTVVEAGTLAPVSVGEVRVLGGDGSTVAIGSTDGTGRFQIQDLPAGTYTVRVRALGYRATTHEDVEVRPGATTELSATLEPQAFEMNPVVVSVVKREERRVDSPAAVEVVQPLDIRERPAVTLADHVAGLAGVDVIRTGLQGNYVTVRGFNNIFSGATLTLTDHRIASVPSLRANVHHMNPTTNLDIERVEVVLGPGSALYGPNAANGAIHSITTSPLESTGGTFSIASGIRQQDAESTPVPGTDSTVAFGASSEPVTHAEGRYALRLGSDVGVKLSGQYFAGREWRFHDPVEVEQRALAETCRSVGFQVNHDACQNFAQGLSFQRPGDVEILRTSVENVAAGRDEDIRRYSLDLRADWRPTEDRGLTFAAGRSTNVNSVDLTGLGAAQVVNWDSDYVQLRGLLDDAFAQIFLNRSGNTESYLLRSGRPLHDRSSLLVGQVQNQGTIGDRHTLVYGADVLHTTPRTRRTINGQNEDDDEITELGGYVQSETELTSRLELVTAARVDTHSRLEDPVFSPRAALVVRPSEGHNVRFTYNRAFSTPTTLNLFLDISGGTVPLGGPFRYDVRAQGATERGMTFRRTDGIPEHMSPFGLLLGTGPRQFRPTTTENLWETAVAVVQASNPEAGGLLASLPVPTGDQVGIDLRVLNPNASEGEAPFQPTPSTLETLADIDPLRPTITNTFETGYRGLIGDRMTFAANVYHTRIHDFTSPLRVNSPNVFLNRGDLEAYLRAHDVPDAQAAALARSIGGEGMHGSAEAPGIPLGVVTPEEAGGTDPAIVLTYENLGDLALWGADVSGTLLVGGGWELSGNAAWVSDDEFEAGDEVVPLNAPTFKAAGSVRYRSRDAGVNGQLRFRHVGGFPANSAVYVGEVDAHTVVDLNAGYELPWAPGVTAQLDVQNLFDTGYRTFVGTPRLGRFALLRIRYDF